MHDINAVKNFSARWFERGSEKSDAHSFWIELLHDVLDVPNPTELMTFELPVDVDGHACFIDVYINRTKALIEQKSRGIDLDKPARQSDGAFLTPFEQAKRYADELSYSRKPRWIITSNFDQIRIYDMDRLDELKPNIITVERLPQEFRRLNFLVDPEDENVYPEIKISKQAGEIVGDLYRAFERADKSVDAAALNKLCVRLVFCLYAEDAFIFNHNQFSDYVRAANDRQRALVELFNVLNVPVDRRDPNLRAELDAFPYVNGDLFGDQSDIPAINREVSHYLLLNAADDSQFNWSGISPTIFGALFESTLNPITRRAGGMHYTSIANIHKVIDPLFLDDLYEEFKTVKRRRKNKRRELERFQLKLAALKFFDPACGSGNFLTETYLSLRRLENEIIRELHGLGALCQIEVSIENFYGIEINDFAVAVARTALWIAENQMLQETEMIIHEDINFLPLTSAAHIVEGNALELDWASIVGDVDYIIGNPPFSGYSNQTGAQKTDVARVYVDADGNPYKKSGKVDYVACWFFKAAAFMVGTQTRAALVATNSITQGEQVADVWQPVYERFGIHIDFAWRTFRWLSESDDMAAVHCVIIGFSHAPNPKPPMFLDGDNENKIITVARNINPYLVDDDIIFVNARTKPLCNVPQIIGGNRLADGGALIIEADDYEEFIRREPRAKKFIRQLIGAEEFLHGNPRYCLWLIDATIDDLQLPLIAERIERCRQNRLKGAADRQKLAATPHLFREKVNPPRAIVIPNITSERRKYIPMDYIDDSVICSNRLMLLPDAGLYEFGVLMSSVHMAWTRRTCGRLEMRYSYLKNITYNNFVWLSPTSAQRSSIEASAQSILDARSLYPSWTLAALYDPNSMPVELRTAHAHNDRLVEELYGFVGLTEDQMAARLLRLYLERRDCASPPPPLRI
ncbi:MAG: restriction endonuclease subunit M [Selenomonadaceae bacterium]|nr:restriction endonuclease subunit M [Selenomonadaceae bacterium]